MTLPTAEEAMCIVDEELAKLRIETLARARAVHVVAAVEHVCGAPAGTQYRSTRHILANTIASGILRDTRRDLSFPQIASILRRGGESWHSTSREAYRRWTARPERWRRRVMRLVVRALQQGVTQRMDVEAQRRKRRAVGGRMMGSDATGWIGPVGRRAGTIP